MIDEPVGIDIGISEVFVPIRMVEGVMGMDQLTLGNIKSEIEKLKMEFEMEGLSFFIDK